MNIQAPHGQSSNDPLHPIVALSALGLARRLAGLVAQLIILAGPELRAPAASNITLTKRRRFRSVLDDHLPVYISHNVGVMQRSAKANSDALK